MFWFRKRRLEAALAASLYDDATPHERDSLESALSRDPVLRNEYDSLRVLRNSIPLDRPELKIDLTPLIRRRLEEVPVHSGGRRLALALGTVSCVLILAALGWNHSGKSTEPGIQIATSQHTGVPTMLGSLFQETDALVKQGDLATAFQKLSDSLAAHPDDPLAADAQLRLADLAFDLKRYPEALAATTTLMTRYHSFVAQSPERERHTIARRDLLAEAEAVQFASLYSLDTARRDRANPLGKLEDVIVGYQNSLVAEEAALDMGKLLLAESATLPDTENPRLTAMTLARDRCSNPVAIALLEIKIGEIYQNDLRDFSSAEAHFMRAAANPVLTQRAKTALASLAEAKSR
ncbi:MAG: tetratricopeptide repeat protein [Candidatus Hydrogenedentales bacterium]|jgi:tetratricopeptide (TPR) repeat protein